IVAHVPHVQPAGGVRQHLQAIKPRTGRKAGRHEGPIRVPTILPFALDGIERVAVLLRHRPLAFPDRAVILAGTPGATPRTPISTSYPANPAGSPTCGRAQGT